MRKEGTMASQQACQKIKSLDELCSITRNHKKNGRTIVHCHGVFDLLHLGHVRHFEAAKCQGDILIVTVTKDDYVNKGPGRPVFNERLRAEAVAALQCVDYVAINEWPTAVETIRKLRPDVYAKGKDYANREDDLTGEVYNEEAAIRSVGGQVHFTDELPFSSTKLLNDHFHVYPEEAEGFLNRFRQSYTPEDVIEQLKDLKKMKVLVIGDAIIDQYHYCRAMGKSPKEMIIPTRYLSEESFAGGILAAANHIAGFCDDVCLVTCLGTQDTQEEFILSHLKPNIKTRFFYRQDAPTVVKRRFVEAGFLTKLFEICFLNDTDLPEPVDSEVCRYLEENIDNYDLTMVADFGHGFISKNIVNVLSEQAKFLAVNVQTNSANTGFNLITKYPKADYICIDEPEIRLATHDRFGKLEDLIVNIAKELQCSKAAVTRGHYGSFTYEEGNGFFKIPVFSTEVVDRLGAGDAYLSITSPCVAAGYPMEMVGFIGDAVGALAVRIVGNKSPVEPVPLFKFITTLLK